MVEELIEEPARPLPYSVDSSVGRHGWAEFGMRLLNRRRAHTIAAPSVSQKLRVAQALDEFAAAFAPAAAVIADPELCYSAERAREWAAEVRAGTRRIADVYPEIKGVVGDLRIEQTHLTLERRRES